MISQPSGLSGTTLCRPAGCRGDQSFLSGVLGGVKMAVPPYQRAQDPRRQLAQQVLEVGLGKLGAQRSSSLRDSAIGRRSITPALTYSGPGHFESSAAISVARSKLSHSMIQ